MKELKQGDGVWIPANVSAKEGLTLEAKLLLCIVAQNMTEDGFNDSDVYLRDLFGWEYKKLGELWNDLHRAQLIRGSQTVFLTEKGKKFINEEE